MRTLKQSAVALSCCSAPSRSLRRCWFAAMKRRTSSRSCFSAAASWASGASAGRVTPLICSPDSRSWTKSADVKVSRPCPTQLSFRPCTRQPCKPIAGPQVATKASRNLGSQAVYAVESRLARLLPSWSTGRKNIDA
eukprot:2939230-Rhodomonas_salina.1